MCGIVYGNNLQGYPVNKKVLKQFQHQRNRGVQGFGLYDNEFKKLVRTPKERKIKSWLKNHPSNEILFHHRYPTSTENVKNACHPFSSRDFFGENSYILVHNGMLWNADTLKREHEALGIEYYSIQPDGRFNDSEALMWDVALYLEGKQDRLHAYGSIAFICIAKRGKKESLFFARNSSPLKMISNEHVLYLASELKDRKAEDIEQNNLYEFDYETHVITRDELIIPASVWESRGEKAPVYTPPKSAPSYGYGYNSNNTCDQQSSMFPYSSDRNFDDFDQNGYWDDGLQRWIDFASDDWEEQVIAGLEARGAKPTKQPSQNELEVIETLKAKTDLNKIKEDITILFKQYMHWADGKFSSAAEMAEADLQIARDQLSDTWSLKAQKSSNNIALRDSSIEDSEYQVTLQEAVLEMILMDPKWTSVDAIDTTYQNSPDFDWKQVLTGATRKLITA